MKVWKVEVPCIGDSAWWCNGVRKYFLGTVGLLFHFLLLKHHPEKETCVCVVLSQAVIVDRTMYISGQLGMDVASGKLVDGGVQAQAKQVKLTSASV